MGDDHKDGAEVTVLRDRLAVMEEHLSVLQSALKSDSFAEMRKQIEKHVPSEFLRHTTPAVGDPLDGDSVLKLDAGNWQSYWGPMQIAKPVLGSICTADCPGCPDGCNFDYAEDTPCLTWAAKQPSDLWEIDVVANAIGTHAGAVVWKNNCIKYHYIRLRFRGNQLVALMQWDDTVPCQEVNVVCATDCTQLPDPKCA